MPYLLAIDQGTTSTTVLIVDEKLRICGSASQEFQQFYPKPEFVEHSPDKIWQSVLEAIGTAIARARIDARQIVGIGIANQRETTIVWERKTGKPIYPAIVWQCRRTRAACEALKAAGVEPMIREKTGLLCDPYFRQRRFGGYSTIVTHKIRHKRGIFVLGPSIAGFCGSLRKANRTRPTRRMLHDRF